MNNRLRGGLVALLVLGLIAPLSGAALAQRTVERRLSKPRPALDLTFVADDGLYKTFRSGKLTEAQYALQRARSLASLGKVRARYGNVARPEARMATLILRDLALRVKELSGADRASAMRVLARPTSPEFEGDYDYGSDPVMTHCTADFCLHWTETGLHSIGDTTDGDANGLPDWVDSVIENYTYIIGTYAGSMGYRPVLSDLTSEDNGSNGLPDVYLANVGANSLYGYCTTDDPNAFDPGYGGFDFSAYCVIDNDFSMDEFPNLGPLENMQVTAAHEFFHAVQFGYDAADDIWFLESTAAWVEDVMFDDINDNYQYLHQSAITYPDFPIDFTDNGDYFILRYGGWLWFRYLTELLGDGTTHNIDIVREMWERAQFRAGHPEDVDDFSIKAVKNVLEDHGYNFEDTFGDFGMFNWTIELFYEEGVDYYNFLAATGADPRPYVIKSHNISSGKPKTGWFKFKPFHLSTANIVFAPKSGVANSAKLLLKVDGPSSASAPEARYIVFYKEGLPDFGTVALNGQGDGQKKVAFGKSSVAYVVLALSNASTRYKDCYQNYPFSCGGQSKDDSRAYLWSGTLKQ